MFGGGGITPVPFLCLRAIDSHSTRRGRNDCSLFKTSLSTRLTAKRIKQWKLPRTGLYGALVSVIPVGKPF